MVNQSKIYLPKFKAETTIYYGPPGTGKTETLLNVIQKELQYTPPNRIAYCSFTREGARQGIRRACERFDYKYEDFPYFRTFHSIAFHFLGLTKDNVMKPSHYNMFGKAIGMRFLGYFIEEITSPDDEYLRLLDLVINNKQYAQKMLLSSDIDLSILKFVIKQLKLFKQEMGIMDFTDMVVEFIKKDEALPVDIAFIDEAQDLTTLQWQMAEIAFRDAKRLYIAGDDDQAIYSWAGADVGIFARLEGKKQVLNVSYRLPPNILSFAKRITDNIKFRVDKEYRANKKEGEEIQYFNSIEDAPLHYPGTYLILVRNRKYINIISDYLMLKGLYFSTKKGNSIKSTDISTLQAWEDWRLLGKVPTDVAILRLEKALGVNYLEADATVSWQYAFTKWEEKYIEYIEKVQRQYELSSLSPIIHLATIHTVKGDEADNVILYTGMSYRSYLGMNEDTDAEHRVFYVGATRARERLMIVFGEDGFCYPIEVS